MLYSFLRSFRWYIVTFPLRFLLTLAAPWVALCLLAIFHVDNTHMDGYRY